MNILSTAAKVSTLNSQFDNEIKKLSDKQKNIKNNQNAVNFKEGNQISKYKKLQIERNLVMRQLRLKLKEEKARQIEEKIKNIEQLTSNPQKCIEPFKIYIKQETTANFMQRKRTDNK